MTIQKKSIILVSGGTGGHFFPAQALYQNLIDKNLNPLFITDQRGALHLKENENCIHQIQMDHEASFLKKSISLTKEFWKSRKILKKINPSLIVGFGGYPTLAPLIAAYSLKIPIILHEQNALLGKANRFIAPFARKIALSFEQTHGVKPEFKSKLLYTGNPVRPKIVDILQRIDNMEPSSKLFTLLVTGGSQGAKIFSDILPKTIQLLDPAIRENLRLVQQVRKEFLDDTKNALNKIPFDAELSPFFDNMAQRIVEADLILCRSGGSTIAENLTIGRPAIYVPLPSAAENHQYYNAKEVENLGAGWLIEQRDLTAEHLAIEIQKYFLNRSILVETGRRARKKGSQNAVDRLANLVTDTYYTTR